MYAEFPDIHLNFKNNIAKRGLNNVTIKWYAGSRQ
jgi:hypothetical protein